LSVYYNTSYGSSITTHELKITLNVGFQLIGIGFNSESGNMRGVNLNDSYVINQYFYEKNSVTNNSRYNYDTVTRDYYLIFQYETTRVNLIADKGGVVSGHLSTYAKSTDTETVNAEIK